MYFLRSTSYFLFLLCSTFVLAQPKPKFSENYHIKRKLSSALYGGIFSCTQNHSNKKCVVKRIFKKLASNKTAKAHNQLVKVDEDITNEIRFLKQFKDTPHHNVVSLFDLYDDETFIYIVMEEKTGGDLFNFLQKNFTVSHSLEERTSNKIIRQLASGLHYLHGLGIAHMDLSLENVLLDGENNCSICDFGLASTQTRSKPKTGKPAYASPENFGYFNILTKESDIWSLGIMFFAVKAGHLPFNEATSRCKMFTTFKKIGSFKTFAEKKYPIFQPVFLDLLDHILVIAPKKRFSIQQILAHRWFQDCSA